MSDVPVSKYYAGGQWREAKGGAVFEDYEPYTGEVFARVADAGAEEARIAIQAAADAFPAWAALPPAEKAKLFFR
ncbi:aldehyde dehydrogenase family protein, partial [Streptomyces sp. NPDC088400]